MIDNEPLNRTVMRILGNILWHIPYCGFMSALYFFFLGLFWCLTIVGLPLGISLLHFARFLLTPFTSRMIDRNELTYVGASKQNVIFRTYGNLLWILYLPFGLLGCVWLFLVMLSQFVTIIGIPCGLVSMKSFGTVLKPFNKVCVSVATSDQINMRK